jgi:catabolite regulation protein CreA
MRWLRCHLCRTWDAKNNELIFMSLTSKIVDPEPDPELEVMDPDPELDMNLTKNHQKKIVI